jgi:hypothetical protein
MLVRVECSRGFKEQKDLRSQGGWPHKNPWKPLEGEEVSHKQQSKV